MIRVFVLCTISLALIVGVQSACDTKEAQRLYNNFENFRQKYFLKSTDSIESYSTSSNGDVQTRRVKSDGGSLTETYKINPASSSIETIDGQLIQDVTTTRYRKTSDGFDFVFSTRNGNDVKFNTYIQDMDLLIPESFNENQKYIVDRLVKARRTMFNFLKRLDAKDFERVQSIEIRYPTKNGFGKAEYMEKGSPNGIRFGHTDEPRKYVGAFICDGTQFDVKIENEKVFVGAKQNTE